jgi:hypothetical protein
LAPLGLSILCVSVAAVSEEFSVPAREVSDERLAMGISTALKSSLRVTIAVDWSLRVAPPLVLDGAAFGTDINWICDVAEMSSVTGMPGHARKDQTEGRVRIGEPGSPAYYPLIRR